MPCGFLLGTLHGSGAGLIHPQVSSASSRARRSAMAVVNVSEEDKTKFLLQDVNEYIQLCEKNFLEHKYDCAESGLKIGHVIISEFLTKRISSTPQGQKVSANNEDIFTMLNVLAKTNATA